MKGSGFRVGGATLKIGFGLGLLGGSWDLVSKVISALIGVVSNYKYSYPIDNPSY